MAAHQDDLHLLGPYQRTNIFTICLGPAYDQLRAFVDVVEASPHLYGPDNIETALQNAVPAIAHLFASTAAWPLDHNPPPPPEIFSFTHLYDAIQVGATMEQNQQGTKPVYARILECLKHDFPENVHTLEPGSDRFDGTRLFCVVEKQYVEIKILPSHAVTNLDPFSECRAYAMLERAERLGLNASTCPNERLMEVTRMIATLWKISLETANLELDVIVVSGGIARRLARAPTNAQGSIDLVSQSLPSPLFGKRVIQEFHPAIFMNSRFPQLRSMLLLRQSIILHWVGNSAVAVEEIYDDLAFLYDRQVLRFTNLLDCIGVNFVHNMNWTQVFTDVSQRIKDWVKHMGTGTRGGNWRQTLSYGGGGCGIFSGFKDRVEAYNKQNQTVLTTAQLLDDIVADSDVRQLRSLIFDLGYHEFIEADPEDDEFRSFATSHREVILARMEYLDEDDVTLGEFPHYLDANEFRQEVAKFVKVPTQPQTSPTSGQHGRDLPSCVKCTKDIKETTRTPNLAGATAEHGYLCPGCLSQRRRETVTSDVPLEEIKSFLRSQFAMNANERGALTQTTRPGVLHGKLFSAGYTIADVKRWIIAKG